jgi:hypothetical protein
LAFFLNPSASHGQGPLFLQTLARLVRPDLTVDCQQPTIAREAQTYSILRNRRLIDIVVTLDGFVLAIENKKFTGEGRDQIHHYCQHLQNIAGDHPFCLVYLTPTGAEATSISREYSAQCKERHQLISWSWGGDVLAWIRECDRHCESSKIRHFIEDFESYVNKFLSIQKQITGSEYDE